MSFADQFYSVNEARPTEYPENFLYDADERPRTAQNDVDRRVSNAAAAILGQPQDLALIDNANSLRWEFSRRSEPSSDSLRAFQLHSYFNSELFTTPISSWADHCANDPLPGLEPLNVNTLLRGLREEVPYERFLAAPKRSPLRARLVSIGHTIEGSIRAVAHCICAVVKKPFELIGRNSRVSSSRHSEVAQAQYEGVKGSLRAILWPDWAHSKYKDVGVSFVSRSWGTLCSDKRTFYLIGSYSQPA